MGFLLDAWQPISNDTDIHHLKSTKNVCVYAFQGHWGGWTRLDTPWTGHQFATGLTQRDKQPFPHIHGQFRNNQLIKPH